MIPTSKIMNPNALVLYANNKRFWLIFKESDACYRDAGFELLGFQVGIWNIPSSFLGVPTSQPLIQIPYLETSIITHSVQPNSKKSCSVESYGLTRSGDLEWQGENLI